MTPSHPPMKTTYSIKYQLSDVSVRSHKTLRAAVSDLRSCQRAARDGGDQQGISIVATDDDGPRTDGPLNMTEIDELDALRT